MKAWTFDRYGSPDVLRLEDVPDPAPGPGLGNLSSDKEDHKGQA